MEERKNKELQVQRGCEAVSRGGRRFASDREGLQRFGARRFGAAEEFTIGRCGISLLSLGSTYL